MTQFTSIPTGLPMRCYSSTEMAATLSHMGRETAGGHLKLREHLFPKPTVKPRSCCRVYYYPQQLSCWHGIKEPHVEPEDPVAASVAIPPPP